LPDVLKTRLKRPRKRGYRATGIRDILLACKDVHLDKQGVTVDWNSLIQNYDLESEQSGDGVHVDDNESDVESETGSMDGLGTCVGFALHMRWLEISAY
jgi:hypothetical protein